MNSTKTKTHKTIETGSATTEIARSINFKPSSKLGRLPTMPVTIVNIVNAIAANLSLTALP
jgi:hypothetical protein